MPDKTDSLVNPFDTVRPDSRTYDEMLQDKRLLPQDRELISAEATIALAAVVLLRRGNEEVARLLLDVVKVSVDSDWNTHETDLWLEVEREHLDQFTEDSVAQIREVCVEVSARRGYGIDWVSVREVLPDVGPQWRDQVKQHLGGGKRPTNHARQMRSSFVRFTEDWLSFTNPGELTVYRELKRIQETNLPPEDTIGIYPLAGGRVLHRTWEPDVLITYKGRAGILEIDGPNHNRRRALDQTRDHLLYDTGIAFVDRVPVESLCNSAELNQILHRFLRRLGEHR
jgi:hypothetical protein